MSNLRRASLVSVSLACLLALADEARAAQTTITISMASPPAAPRIQPPLVVGATPATPFLYSIPATGQPPLTFTATGLPSGLTLDAGAGTISGTAPAAGSYTITVGASNGAGSATATLTLMSGTMLRPTPPLGWNSYDSYGASIKESEVLAQAQALKSTLQPFGWNTVVIDYRWYDPEDKLDSNGRYLPSGSKYPSATGTNGFKSLADQVHGLGLLFGIHIMRGIPRAAVTANAPIANSTYHATDAANTNDACPWDTHMWGVNGGSAAGQAWYDALFAQYAQWGIDFIKIDDMLNNSTKTYHQAEADAIRKAVGKSGRAIVVSFSPGADDSSWLPSSVANLNADAEMWRIVDDFWDYNAITNLAGAFTSAGSWQASSGLVQGHWPDTDMLPLGYLGPRCEWHTSGETTFTHNDQVTVMSLWSILPSPLIFGGNVQSLTTDTTTGPWTLALLTNEEVLAVNQDALGTHAKRIAQQGSTEVWARDLSGGRKAVALFNRGSQDARVAATFSPLGVWGTPSVRDVWNRADVTGMTTGISVSVPYAAAKMYVLSPASTGTGTGGAGGGGAAGRGGAGGAGAGGASGSGGGGTGGRAGAGGAGTGGASGVGGATGQGGSGAGSGGSSGSGGTSSGSGGSTGSGGTAASGGNTGSGGNASSGGNTGSGGASSAGSGGAAQTGGTSGSGGTTGDGSGSGGGCSCDLGAEPPTTTAALLLLAGASLLRRKRRSSSGSGPSDGSQAPRDELLAAKLRYARRAPSPRSAARPAFSDEQLGDARPHVVADLPDARERLSLGILERPVVAAEARDDRALLAAAHGDQELRAASELVGQLLRLSLGEVDAHLAHGLQHLGVNFGAGVGAGGEGARPGGVGQRVEPGGRHLRAAGVVNAREDDRIHGVHDSSSSERSRSTTRSATLGRAGTSQRKRAVAAAAPATWAMMNPGASAGRMPAKVSLAARASVTAGLANDVDDVNQ
jgi:alpha-galactosidase